MVLDFDGLSDAADDLNQTKADQERKAPVSASNPARKAKAFGKPIKSLSAATGSIRPTTTRFPQLLQDRQSCPSGQVFYACGNGFTGCCSVDPCGDGGSCSDGTSTAVISIPTGTSVSQTSDSSASLTTSSTAPSTVSSKSTPVTSSTSSSGSNSITSTSSMTTSAAAHSPTALAAPPTCPSANNTIYTDHGKIQYAIHCNADNSYESNGNVTVSTGGYGECFSACSINNSCAGFTYVGLDDGDCYLKGRMPASSYIPKAGSNYISCAKVDPSAADASVGAQLSTNNTKAKTGAVAGGVIGGVAFLFIVILLVAIITKHRRQMIDEQRRATNTTVLHGPLESVDMTQSPLAVSVTMPRAASGHVRSGSTAHDAYAPYGGSYHPHIHTRQRSKYQVQTPEPNEQHWA